MRRSLRVMIPTGVLWAILALDRQSDGSHWWFEFHVGMFYTLIAIRRTSWEAVTTKRGTPKGMRTRLVAYRAAHSTGARLASLASCVSM
ncbi:hypothetical protein FA95DRAFT_145434 [Auriscalpium vulgare]|uniref:Uncharacterized protein n=1 Tax=Auriscalpium vulgare TaxID=40419 RepID=A0ACB8S6S4_9AGAM|nr:hypothetical protein FA95DRAFT_145434 [Auriscalpium vulgare]